MPMTLATRLIGKIAFLDLSGRMLINEGDDMLREAVERLTQQGTVKLVLNMSGVTYVDSAGLGEIVRSLGTTQRKGGKLVLFYPQKQLLGLLSITKLRNCFTVFEDGTEEEAIRSFAK